MYWSARGINTSHPYSKLVLGAILCSFNDGTENRLCAIAQSIKLISKSLFWKYGLCSKNQFSAVLSSYKSSWTNFADSSCLVRQRPCVLTFFNLARFENFALVIKLDEICKYVCHGLCFYFHVIIWLKLIVQLYHSLAYRPVSVLRLTRIVEPAAHGTATGPSTHKLDLNTACSRVSWAVFPDEAAVHKVYWRCRKWA